MYHIISLTHPINSMKIKVIDKFNTLSRLDDNETTYLIELPESYWPMFISILNLLAESVKKHKANQIIEFLTLMPVDDIVLLNSNIFFLNIMLYAKEQHLSVKQIILNIKRNFNVIFDSLKLSQGNISNKFYVAIDDSVECPIWYYPLPKKKIILSAEPYRFKLYFLKQ